MKPMGIVRRVDDLGRVVIPKEIRRQNGWESGTPLEMFATEDGVFMREYLKEVEVTSIMNQLHEAEKLANNESIKEAIQAAREFIGRG